MNAGQNSNWKLNLVMMGITLVEFIFMVVLVIDAMRFRGQVYKSEVVHDLLLILGLTVLVKVSVYVTLFRDGRNDTIKAG